MKPAGCASSAPSSNGTAAAELAHDRRLVQRPEDLLTFRIARLRWLLDVVATLELKKPLDIERLGFYDFFVANPFLAVGDDEAARREVALAGFSSYDLSYQSSGHRFANRRARLRNDWRCSSRTARPLPQSKASASSTGSPDGHLRSTSWPEELACGRSSPPKHLGVPCHAGATGRQTAALATSGTALAGSSPSGPASRLSVSS